MVTLSCRMSLLALVTATSGLPCVSSTMNFTVMPPSLPPCSSRYIWKPLVMSTPSWVKMPVRGARKPMVRSSAAAGAAQAPAASAPPQASAASRDKMPVMIALPRDAGHPRLAPRQSMAKATRGAGRVAHQAHRRMRKPRPRGPGLLSRRWPLFAEFAGREVAAVDRLLKELVLAVSPELADVGIGLDHRVPELGLVVTEHRLLLDLLDVDVLHRVAHVVERHRAARRVDFQRHHHLDELLGARIFAVGLFDQLVDHLRG